MKYKLKKSTNIKIYIDVNEMLNIYENMGKKILDSLDDNLEYINNNPEYKHMLDTTVAQISHIVDKNDYYKNKHTGLIVQKGGAPLLIPFLLSGASSSIILTTVLSYFFFRFLTGPKCRPSYPLSIIGPVPTYKDIVIKIVPPVIVEKILPNVEDISDNELINLIKSYLETFSGVLNLIAPDSAIGQAITSVVELTAGVAVTALEAITAGAAVVVNYIMKIFNLAKDAFGLLLKFIDSIIKLFDVLKNDDSKRILNDLLTVDFSNGPFGVKCWVNYIIDKYGKDNEFMKYVCGIFNKILSIVYNKFISFISKALTFAIPDGGIAGVLFSAFISLLKCKTYDFALLKLNNAYDKMSYDKQILFEKPKLMKDILDTYLAKGKGFIDTFDSVVTVNIKNALADTGDFSIFSFLSNNTEMFSYTISKMFAIVFGILELLSKCAKYGFCDNIISEMDVGRVFDKGGEKDGDKSGSKKTDSKKK